MKSKPTMNSAKYFSLALALVWTICTRAQAAPAAGDQPTVESHMMAPSQEMKGHRPAMGDMQAQDAALTEQVRQMNRAAKGEKVGQMTAILTKVAEQQMAMETHMAKMHAEGMKPTMHAGIQTEKESMVTSQPMTTHSMTDHAMLAEQVAKMNSAPEGEKMVPMISVLRELAAKQTTTNAHMAKMHAGTMQPAIQHEGMKAQDNPLTAQIARISGAPDDEKTGLMAAAITRMVEQRTAMYANMEKMHGETMHSMQMGKESMASPATMSGASAKSAEAVPGNHTDQN